jgi:hypothetical protein
VPYAPRHFLETIEPDVIKAVPKKIAEEYQVVPIKLEPRTVHLAFVSPKDLRALDALRFATGRSVIAWIAPEVRVFQALEKYYGIARRSRYVKLDHTLDQPKKKKDLPPAEKLTPVPTQQIGALGPTELDATFGYGRPWQEVAAELFEGDQQPVGPKPPTSVMSLPELAERYCRSESRDDLAQAVLEFCAGRAERMLLMFVRGNRASVWDERGFSFPDGERIDVEFEVTSEALFHLLSGNDHYHGAFPPGEETVSFYHRLGLNPPSELLLIPVHVNDHLVAAALVDGGTRNRIQGDPADFLKAFRLFSTAVLMVALRKNLRDVARPLTRVGED